MNEELRTTVDAPTEDERFPPDYRRERHENAESRHAEFRDGLRYETREYVTDSGQRNDATAAMTEHLPGGWVARWVYAEQDGLQVVRSLTIEAEGRATPPGGITADTLRKGVSPRRAADTAQAAVSAAGAVDPESAEITPEVVRLVFARGTARRQGPRTEPRPTRGRPRLDNDFLAAVALAYLDEQEAGRGILARVGARIGPLRGIKPRHVVPQTVKDWVAAARRRGFLTPADKQGRRGAQPGPALNEYLEQLQIGVEGE